MTDKTPRGMILVADALARVLESVAAPLGEEEVALDAALGRVLARDVAALRTQPPFPNAAMDGYAVRAGDTANPPVALRVIGESAAGRGFDGRVGPGEAARIFTGAPMPDGADAVVIQEDVTREGDAIRLAEPVPIADNLRPAGVDFRDGEALLSAGRRLTPRDVALAAAAHHPRVFVRRRARVAILATGDELVAPGEPLGPAQIVASNNFAIAGVAAACGAESVDLGVARDTTADIERAIGRATGADVLVTLGGASVGDYDLVQKTLIASGMTLDFWRLAMRPGKPLMHGVLGDMQVLGLPGNPTSSMVCALLFLRPLLMAMHGEPDAGADPTMPGRLGADVRANGPRQDYMRVTLARGGDGVLVATPIASQDSSLVKGMARADGLMPRPPQAPPGKAGEACRVIPFAALGM